MSEQGRVFLKKMSEKIRNGEYDESLNIPFATRELLYASVKARIDKKIETGATPLLSDSEIKDATKDTKETAAITCEIFYKAGITEKTEGGFIISDKWKRFLKI